MIEPCRHDHETINYIMKHTTKLISPPTALFITATLAISGSAHGAIAWTTVNPFSLGADTPTTFTNSASQTSDVEVDVMVSHAGTISASPTVAAPHPSLIGNLALADRIVWTNDALISAGQTISFNFDFNFQLGSTFGRRAATYFATTLLDGTVDLMMYGGNDTLQNYFGTPTLPATTHTNPGVLLFNDATMPWQDTATLNSFTSANSISLTQGPGSAGQGQTGVGIADALELTEDYSFSGWQYEYTSNVDVPAGTVFLFSLDGVNIGPAIPVPEPTGSLLALISLSAFALRRQR